MASTLVTNYVLDPAREIWDLVVVGGGPAGLAVAIVAAQQGLSVLVLERRNFPPDKACGEGLLPPGVHALERLGVIPYLDRARARPFAGIRFIQEDRSSVEVLLPDTGGLGIRRTALVEAMTRRAEDLGAVVRHKCSAYDVELKRNEAVVRTRTGEASARLLIAADGLHSPLRRAAGLEAARRGRRRFALRQHFKVRPWTEMVETYVDRYGEAVVTPVSDDSVNINFVWEEGALQRPTIASLASRFPALQSRLGDAPAISSVKGAGPLARGATRRTCDRMVLVGDAAGFLDSISGEGLSITFNSALILGRHLPRILASGATRRSMRSYERAACRLFRSYSLVTTGLLWLARHPRVRVATINYFARHPAICGAVTNRAMRLMASAV